MFVGIYFVYCALSSFQLTNGAATKTNDDTKIVFPGPIQDVSNRLGTVDVPEECKDKNFCTVKPHDYPQKLFNELVKGKFKEPPFQPTYVMTENRFRDPDVTVDDCDTHIVYEPVFLVKPSHDNDWRTVVQSPEEYYSQKVRLEICANPNKSCFKEFRLPIDTVALCVQKFTEWQFVVYDGKNGTEEVSVELPTCCSCRYKTTL